MATPTNQDFHKMKMANARRSVEILLSVGAKSGTPQLLAQRMARPYVEHKRLPDNSTGSKNRPFFYTPDQSTKPLGYREGVVEGGVLKDYKYAKFVLNRRARDMARIAMEKEGLDAPADPLLVLSELESRSLELNNLLQLVQDAIDAGDISNALVVELKNVLRIFVALLPTFNENEIGEYKDMIGEMYDTLLDLNIRSQGQPSLYPNPARNSTAVSQVVEFFARMNDLIKEYSRYVNYPKAEKDVVARDLLKKLFKTTARKLNVPVIDTESQPTLTQPPTPSVQSRTTSYAPDDYGDDDDFTEGRHDNAISALQEYSLLAPTFAPTISTSNQPLSTSNAISSSASPAQQMPGENYFRNYARNLYNLSDAEVQQAIEDGRDRTADEIRSQIVSELGKYRGNRNVLVSLYRQAVPSANLGKDTPSYVAGQYLQRVNKENNKFLLLTRFLYPLLELETE